MAEKMMVILAESGHPIFRATSPLSRAQLKSKGGGKLSIHYCADLDTIKTVLRTIISVNQLSLYGAVSKMCEEYESFHDRTGQPVMRGQSSSSFVPSVIKTEVPLDCDDRAHKDFLLQRYRERIEKLSQQDKISKFFMDAGFLNVVEIGQYFMTKDTAEFSQFTDAVACREYALPRGENHLTRMVGFEGTPKVGPYWKLQPVVSRQIWSRDQNHVHEHRQFSLMGQTFSWLKQNGHESEQQETSETQFEQYALRLNASLPAHPQELFLLERELGLTLNQENIRSTIIQCPRN